jgi:hypothetical protein
MGHILDTSDTSDSPGTLQRLTASLRDEREALLHRASPGSPIDGAIALAHAYLTHEEWFQQLPNNAMEDAEVIALAQVIEEVIAMRLRFCRREYERRTNNEETSDGCKDVL